MTETRDTAERAIRKSFESWWFKEGRRVRQLNEKSCTRMAFEVWLAAHDEVERELNALRLSEAKLRKALRAEAALAGEDTK